MSKPMGYRSVEVVVTLLACVTSFSTAALLTPSHPLSLSHNGRSSSSPSRPRTTRLDAQRQATFGMGCFWAPSEELLKTEGVLDTVVGYTGNPSAKSPPTYDRVCFGREWVEGVRVTYDDATLSYEELLEAFFETQAPKEGSRQYASLIFPHDKDQDEVARRWIQKNVEENRTRVRDGVSAAMTRVEPLSPFYQAEGYHQRYWQKLRPRMAVALVLLGISTGLVDSIVPDDLQSTLHTAANGAFLLGSVYVLLERKVDAKVIELS